MAGLIQLHSADPSDHLEALSEVSDFALTDMGLTGRGPWTYRKLTRPGVMAEIHRLSNTCSLPEVTTDALSFQPCPSSISDNQDRYVAQTWTLSSGTWVFCAVLDGHVNSYCVDYARDTLPPLIKQTLTQKLDESANGALVPPEAISSLLSGVVVEFDSNLTAQLLQLVPEHLTGDPPSDVASQPFLADGYRTAQRCMGGCAVIFSLLDPAKTNLWVTNLGDCQAVLGLKEQGGEFVGAVIGDVHNVNVNEEIQRMRLEHPGEPHCIENGRVLGFFEPTRAIGDTWVKISRHYIERLFIHVEQDWISSSTLLRCAEAIQTPPYISNVPDVHHRALTGHPIFLILCSDGLKDLYTIKGQRLVDHWVSVVGGGVATGDDINLAIHLLQDAIGGEDLSRASQILTVEMEDSWIDDTTIIIQRIWV